MNEDTPSGRTDTADAGALVLITCVGAFELDPQSHLEVHWNLKLPCRSKRRLPWPHEAVARSTMTKASLVTAICTPPRSA